MDLTRQDPLHLLPYEAWVRCMQLYASDQPGGALPLLAVSSAWEHNLLTTPEIWNIIYFDGGDDEECRTECFFQFSRTEPVDLILDRNSGGMDIAIKYGNRIRSLTFRTKHTKAYSSADILRFSHKLSIRTYPNLVQVHVEPPCYVDDLIPLSLIQACPALVSIQGAYVDQKIVPSVTPLTTRLGICGDGVLPNGIGDHLKALRIRCIPGLVKKPREGGEEEEDPHCVLFTGPTSFLETFEIEYGVETRTSLAAQWNPFARQASYLFPILSFASTSHRGLKTFSIIIPWYEIGAIVPCLYACTALRELRLVLDCSLPTSGDWNDPVMTRENIWHLKTLSLSSTPRHGGDISQTHFPLIIQLFARNNALFDLEELHLGLEDELVSISSVVTLLKTIKQLKVLHLTRFENGKTTATNDEKVLLSHLHTLIISDNTDLQYLDVPNLVCLECTDPLESYHLPTYLADSLESITIAGSALFQWNDALCSWTTDRPPPRLLTVRLTSGQLDHQPSAPLNYINLRRISFEEGIVDPSPLIGDSLLNHFMLEMLFAPDNCPNLHTIRCDTYPNWALATAMFCRRNSSKRVTPIDSFWLHGQPHMVILALLTKAIQAMEEDSTNSIAIAAGVDRILRRRWARSIDFFRERACQHCIMAGYIACISTHEISKSAEPPDDPVVTEILDLYPESAGINPSSPFTRDEWVEHLKNTSLSSDYAIKRTCGRHDPIHPLRVGSNTLDGASYDAF